MTAAEACWHDHDANCQEIILLRAKLSAALEAKAQAERERDEARKIVADMNNELIGSHGYFTTPSCVEAVRKVKDYSGKRYREAEVLRSLVRTLVEALEKIAETGSKEYGGVPTAEWATCVGIARATLKKVKGT